MSVASARRASAASFENASAADRGRARDRRLGLADRARPAAAQRMHGRRRSRRSRWPARSAARSRSSAGDGWLLASVRNQKQDRRGDGGGILANIDFLGEGTEEKLTGKHPQLPPRRHPLSDPRRADLSRRRPRTCARSTPPTGAARSRSAPSIRPTTSAPASMSMPCSASTSRCSARPVPASRPAPR